MPIKQKINLNLALQYIYIQEACYLLFELKVKIVEW